jgi:hypothetical protein
MYLICLLVDTLITSIGDGISCAHGSQLDISSKKANVWLPLPVVREVLPHLVKVDDKVPVTSVGILNLVNFVTSSIWVLIQAPSPVASQSSDVIDLTGDEDIGFTNTECSHIIDLTMDSDESDVE